MVITGAPNLSNEAGVRGEVKTVSAGESDVWGMKIGGWGDLCEDNGEGSVRDVLDFHSGLLYPLGTDHR